MIGFLGADVLYEQQFDPERDFLVSGVDETASVIRESSLAITPYSSRQRRSFASFSAYDSEERLDGVGLLLGDCSADFQMPVIYIGGSIAVPYMTSTVAGAYDAGMLPAERTVWYIGARDFSADECAWARYNQRLMADGEIDIETAVKTALSELAGTPCRVMLNIDIIDPVWAPYVRHQAGFGYDPKTLLKALLCFEGGAVSMVQVCGLGNSGTDQEKNITSRLAAELARELSLAVFPFKLIKA